MNEEEQVKVFRVTTRKMYEAFADSLYDAGIEHSEPWDVLQSLIRGDIDGIRRSFVRGYTSMLVPWLMKEIDDSYDLKNKVEIRVYHGKDEKLIGVVIDSEVGY